MTVTSINYKGTELKITDPKMAKALESLNRNGDSRISEEDLIGQVAITNLPEAVADVMDKAGFFKYETSRQGFIGFLESAAKVKQFAKITEDWKKNHTDTWGWELEFKADYWNSNVLPYINIKGDFSVQKMADISKQFIDSLLLLTGSTDSTAAHMKGCYVLDELIYNKCALTADLRSFVKETVGSFETGILWLKNPYNEVECEGSGCPEDDTIGLGLVNFPFYSDGWHDFSVTEGINTVFNTRGSCGGGGVCFAGGTYLKTEGEDSKSVFMNFDAVKMLSVKDGRYIPKQSVASYDECSGDTVFQKPTELRIRDLGGHATKVMHLVLKDADGTEMKLDVTPDHRLLAIKNSGERWVRAGKLQDGDKLVTEDGTNLTVDMAHTVTEFTTTDLYNLSFSTEEGDKHPTYYVSPNGKKWIPAHNAY